MSTSLDVIATREWSATVSLCLGSTGWLDMQIPASPSAFSSYSVLSVAWAEMVFEWAVTDVTVYVRE